MPLNMNSMGSSGVAPKLRLKHPYIQTTISDIYNDSITSYSGLSIGSGPNGELYQLEVVDSTHINVKKCIITDGHLTETQIPFTIPDYIFSDSGNIGRYGSTLIPDPKLKDIVYLMSGSASSSPSKYCLYKLNISTKTATCIESTYGSSNDPMPAWGVGYMTMVVDYNSYKCYAITIANSDNTIRGTSIDLHNGHLSFIYRSIDIGVSSNVTEYDGSILPIYGTSYYVFQYRYRYGEFWLFDASQGTFTKCTSPYDKTINFKPGFRFPTANHSYTYSSYMNYSRHSYSKKIKDNIYLVGHYGLLLYVNIQKLYIEILDGGIQDMMMCGYTSDGSLYINDILDSVAHGSESDFYLFGIGDDDPHVAYTYNNSTVVGQINLDFIY